MALPSPSCLTAQLHFLARNPKYEYEKPYTLRYIPSPKDGLSQSNIDRVQHEVKFNDLRLRSLDYSECGFTVTDCSSTLQYDDYADTDKIEKIHAPEVMVATSEAGSGSRLLMYDVDHTYEGGRAIIQETFGGEADAILARRWHLDIQALSSVSLASVVPEAYLPSTRLPRDSATSVSAQHHIWNHPHHAVIGLTRWLASVWHPLRGPLVDWPLALCDAQTVDFARDTMAGDVVDRDHVFENTQVHFNEGQRWFYLSNQLPTELLIFKNADSQEPLGANPGVPHASFDNPITSKGDFRRESIEMRVLVQWD
ncbi:methyltransferase CmcJ [Colletotrichum tamarilloi]|uniref:Methyltransferase CmcJ n=1 Tax=Colletotrichum tamarilloi TaxID=1209934 RepID=A0ABQ9QXR0_9PEZI|nr:methyltransferase CmcJ [Colletotrichum tamarilloi]KAK1488903.1 methyltransferase CmcJ [Colletotrichum tamarilloi]